MQDFRPTDEHISLAEIFTKQHKERMGSLAKYGWLD